ncbi:MAG: hypothetical protein DCC67_11355 [Planctomycetota bacterium]|nr:MAG: hypothetical protein DCC67_11355 [Planctomycetota bacterium]
MVKEESDRLSVLRRELRQQLGAERYELWVGPQTELEICGDSLRVSCGSPAVAHWLRRNLQATLSQCAESTLGFSPTIQFCSLEPPTRRERAPKRDAAHGDAGGHRQLCFEELNHDGDMLAAGDGLPSTAASVAEASSPRMSRRPAEDAAQAPRWNFAEFVVGDGNRLAAQAALQAAQQPGRFSPLLLYGPSGCGKSHLLQAICQCARTGPSRPRVMQLTCEQFTTQFLEALERRAGPSLRQKFRYLDVLAVDDVPFLVGKRATLEELLYTIDALSARGAQVVLTSNRPVAELHALSVELASRISSGLAIAIEPPDYATRLGIVRAAAARMKIELQAGVAELVAQQVLGSGRMLMGALNRLVAAEMAAQAPITFAAAERIMAEFCRQHSPQVRLADIQRAVCEEFGVESAALKSQRKTRALTELRMLAMWLARKYTRATFSEIGDFFGRRSHSTVVAAQRKCDKLISRRSGIAVGDEQCEVEQALRRIEAKLRKA